MPTRRRLLVAALAAAPLLASCGFALRKTPEFHFQTIALAMPSTALGQQLRRQLGNAGSVRLSDKPAKAEIVFESAGERRINEILSRNADGEVRERLLGIVITFRVRTGNGRELLPLTEIERQIEQSYDESAADSKWEEAQLLYSSMQSDIVQQIMRQLASGRP